MTDSNDSVNVSRRLRPLRLALLVDPSDSRQLSRAVAINTSHWGGLYNPIVPAFRKRPSWWRSDYTVTRLPSAREIVDGYLNLFEPDFVVDLRRSSERSYPVSGWPALKPQEVQFDGEASPHAGTGVHELYRHRHQTEFRFDPRTGQRATLVVSPEESLELFTGVCFGLFPKKWLEDDYRLAFQPDVFEFTQTILLQVFGAPRRSPRMVTPLTMGSSGLAVRHPFLQNYMLVVDPGDPIDLIDFWNLRALGHWVLPMPQRWARDCIPRLAEMTRALPDTAPLHWIPGRRAQDEAIAELKEEFRESQSELWLGEYPLPEGGHDPAAAPPEIAAAEDIQELTIREHQVRIPVLAPDFVDDKARFPPHRWVNVLNLNPSFSVDELISVAPAGIRGIANLVGHWIPRDVRVGREGILVLSSSDRPLEWRLPSGHEVMETFLSERGFDARLSEPGRLALEMARRIGGLTYTGLLQDPELLRVMNGAAGGEPIERQTLLQVLGKRLGHGERLHSALRALVERGVLQAGPRIRCPHCTYRNWYPVDELGEKLRCRRCMRDFPFPQSHPPKDSEWAYRGLGGFGFPDYARGSYSVLLALRFLVAESFNPATWSPSLELGDQLEFDFALWSLNSAGWRPAQDPTLVFGLCKSFGDFTERDFHAARILRRAFKESIIVFASLSERISAKDRQKLRRLARPAVNRIAALPAKPRLMILTAKELFSRRGAPECWGTSDGTDDSTLSLRFTQWHSDIHAIADITQELHLGLQPWGKWLSQECRRLAR